VLAGSGAGGLLEQGGVLLVDGADGCRAVMEVGVAGG